MNKMRVVVFGLGPQFKGGIANYTTSLAKTLDKIKNVEVHLVSWIQQYPAIIPRDFIDRSSKTDLLEGTNVKVNYLTNYNNPKTWHETYRTIVEINPDIVLFQWSIALQGIPLGYITRKLRKHQEIEIIFDLHFVVQKEGSIIDNTLTKYGISCSNSYVVHSFKTAAELKQTFPKFNFILSESGKRSPDKNLRNIIKLYHPVYDMFTPASHFDIEAEKCRLKLKKNVFLSFGFIRHYKGLHNTIKAFARVKEKRDDVTLLIVGESLWSTLDPNKLSTKIKMWFFKFLSAVFIRNGESGLNYQPLDLIDEFSIADSVTVVNEYIANEDVHKYLQVSDCMILYYLTATPSGVESLAYNFNLPILATRIGHFPETIKEGFNGYLAEPDDIDSMAETMIRFLEQPIQKQNVAKRAAEFSWENYAKSIINK